MDNETRAAIKLMERIEQLEAKIATVITLIENEEWNADFRDVLLAELGDGK